MLKLSFSLKHETKTCYRFETGSREADNLTTLYLKKADVDGAQIDPHKGITVTVEEAK